ncbi:MAG: hypothetical protein GX442_14455 [Candidatus Riflebacteria bacterium]|nr:hypothetical protein [Candidatus Riflebacteria bacterium]
MERRWLLLVGVGALIALFAASAVFIVRSADRLPAIEVVVSPPHGWQAGEPQEIVFYIREQETSRPVTDLPVHLVIDGSPGPARGLVPAAPALADVPLAERRPGVYQGRVTLPTGIPEGPFHARLFLEARPDLPLASFDLRVQPALALLVIPPETPLWAGSPLEFLVAGFDLVTARPVTGLPIRVKMIPPSGIEIVNRTIVTPGDGIGRVHLHAPAEPETGLHQIRFSAGPLTTSLHLELPPRPALPVATLLEASFPWIRLVHTTPGLRDLPGIAPPPLHWESPPPPEPPGIEARLIDQALFLTYRRPWPNPHQIEVWLRNHLFYTYAVPAASETLRVPFAFSLPQGLPVRIRLWEASGSQVLATDLFLPPQREGVASDSVPAWLARRLDVPVAEVLRRLLTCHVPPPLRFTTSLRDGTLTAHLRQWLRGIMSVFPAGMAALVVFLLVVPPRRIAPDSPEAPILARHFAATSGCSVVALAGFLLPPPAATVVTLAAVAILAFLAVVGVLAGHFRTFFRFGTAVQLMGAFLAGLAGADLLAHRLAIDPTLVWPGAWPTGTALAAMATMFAWIGGHHLPFLADRWRTRLLTTGTRLLTPFLASGWKGALSQALILAVAFWGVFWGLERLGRFDPLPPRPPPADATATTPPTATLPSLPALDFRLESPPPSPFELPAPGIASWIFPLVPLAPSRRGGPGRFLLVTHGQRWTGRPIRRLEVILEEKEFWNRLIDSLAQHPPSATLLAQQAKARCDRFPLLDPDEREAEIPVLEATLGDLAHFLVERIRARRPLSPLLKASLEEVFFRLSDIIAVDPTVKVHVRSAPVSGPQEPDEPPDGGLAVPLLEIEGEGSHHPLSSIRLGECFQTGGELILSGPRGTAAFQIQPETFSLTRGTSFRQDFEIDRIDLRRRHPLILRVQF